MEQEKKKMHILDKIFIILSFIIPIIAMLGDYIMWYGVTEGGFPVCTVIGIFPYGILVTILAIIAKIKKIDVEYCKLWIILFIPWLYIGVAVVELLIAAFVINIVNK